MNILALKDDSNKIIKDVCWEIGNLWFGFKRIWFDFEWIDYVKQIRNLKIYCLFDSIIKNKKRNAASEINLCIRTDERIVFESFIVC